MKLHAIKYKAKNKKAHVSGVLKLDNAYLPFKYQIHEDDDFDHEAHLDELEKKGKKWEKHLKRLNTWANNRQDKVKHKKTGADVDVTIHDCTLMPLAADDWHLFCKVQIGDKIHRFNVHYKDPDDAMSIAQLKDLIAQAIEDDDVATEKARKHKEKLSAIAGQVQAPTTRLFD